MEFQVVFSLVDAYGRNARKVYFFEAADHSTALVEAGLFNADLEAISGLRVLKYNVGQDVAVSDTADATANRDEGATFSVRKADNDKAVVKVPGPVDSIRNPDGTIDITATAVTNFFDNFLSGVVRVSDGEVMTELISGTLDQ